jgi:hypothetical protein
MADSPAAYHYRTLTLLLTAAGRLGSDLRRGNDRPGFAHLLLGLGRRLLQRKRLRCDVSWRRCHLPGRLGQMVGTLGLVLVFAHACKR